MLTEFLRGRRQRSGSALPVLAPTQEGQPSFVFKGIYAISDLIRGLFKGPHFSRGAEASSHEKKERPPEGPDRITIDEFSGQTLEEEDSQILRNLINGILTGSVLKILRDTGVLSIGDIPWLLRVRLIIEHMERTELTPRLQTLMQKYKAEIARLLEGKTVPVTSPESEGRSGVVSGLVMKCLTTHVVVSGDHEVFSTRPMPRVAEEGVEGKGPQKPPPAPTAEASRAGTEQLEIADIEVLPSVVDEPTRPIVAQGRDPAAPIAIDPEEDKHGGRV